MAKVIILGGGVAGMSAAHELAERGFQVVVYESKVEYVGGKARSVNVPNSNTSNPDLYLPGEHGFRFFPGFYQHLFETLKKIPVEKGSSKTCFDNLVATETVQILQTGKFPVTLPMHFPSSLQDVVQIFMSFLIVSKELTKEEVEFFAARIWQLMTSCQARFENEYEQISWWEYTQADKFSDDYKKLFVEGLTRSLVAAKAKKASTRTVGSIFLQLLYTMIGVNKSATDSVLNGPTNEAWLTPWYNYLIDLGVTYNKGMMVSSINMESAQVNSSIASVTLTNVTTGESIQDTADYYLLAVPVEVAAQLINEDMLGADASLANIITLAPNVEWMNGIQFYLNKPFDMHKGHTIYSDSKWALTSISQAQFWPSYSFEGRYNGKVQGILSVDISDWDAPGNFNNKPAKDCTIEEVIEEVWAQLKQEINIKGLPILTDSMREFVYLDSDIQPTPTKTNLLARLPQERLDKLQKLMNKEPLLVNQVNTWTYRPNSYTFIPNLFLASDYVKTNTNLATMEGANEAAKRAVNNIIKASKSDAKLCTIYKFKDPLLLEISQVLDKDRFSKGLSWKN